MKEAWTGRWLPFALLCLAALTVAALAPAWHDYLEYLDQWERVAAGENPWVADDGSPTSNAYGPLHNVLALPASAHPALPRILFVGLYLLGIGWLLRLCRNRGDAALLAAISVASPFFWISTAAIGHNDTLPAVLTLFAVHTFRRDRTGISGALLGLAFLTKLYPAVVLPFLAVRRGRIEARLLLAFTVTCLAGYLASWLIWEERLFDVYLFAADRQSKLLSIFRVLRGRFSPVPIMTGLGNLDWLSAPLVLAALAGLFGLHLRRALDPALAAAAAIATTFALYKVGHMQFYATPLLLLVYWRLTEGRDVRLPRSLAAYIAWFSLVPLAYVVLGEFRGRFVVVRDVIGLPCLAVQAWLLWELLRGARAGPDQSKAATTGA